MDRFDDMKDDEPIDLGTATIETKGPPGGGKDSVGFLIQTDGLSHD